MSNFSRNVEEVKERKEKNRMKVEKASGYFFDLSKLSFAGIVIGSVTPIFSDDVFSANWYLFAVGVLCTFVLAKVAFIILK